MKSEQALSLFISLYIQIVLEQMELFAGGKLGCVVFCEETSRKLILHTAAGTEHVVGGGAGGQIGDEHKGSNKNCQI